MVDPLTLSALISGGASLIGGAAARAGVKKGAQDEIRGKILAGKEFGLHPLASIGANTSSGAASGSYIGDGIARAGEAAAEAVRGRAERKDAQTLNNKQAQLVDAQIEESRSRTLLNQAEARSRTAIDPFQPRQENALIAVKLENGEIIYVPNPDIYEISPTELATGRSILEGGRVVKRTQDKKEDPVYEYKGPHLGYVKVN